MATNSPVLDPELELDQWIGNFERAWRDGGEISLASFIPTAEHPHFNLILCEMICVDLEMRWSRGMQKPLSDYRREFPAPFENQALLQELAYEEYRQRIQAGLPVELRKYQTEFGVDVSGWPSARQKISTQVADQTRVLQSKSRLDLPNTLEARAAIMEDLQQSAPGLALRLKEATAQLPQPGEQLFGFEIVEELGAGAFAKVYLAKQAELADRPVALKVAASLHDEPRKLARLQHTNIVPIYSVHHGDCLQAVCMPYLGPTTLAHILKNMSDGSGIMPESGKALLDTLFNRRSTLPNGHVESVVVGSGQVLESESAVAAPIRNLLERFSHVEAVLWIGARLADGLAHAHERGILHLDIKPANILLADDGQPMLLDFNLSIDTRDTLALQTARFGGTLPYMSPEQLEAFGGDKKQVIDARSDLFAIGVILFEMLTGTAPFPKRTGRLNQIVAMMIADRKLRPISLRQQNAAVPNAVEAIVRKLLDPDPARRYRHAAQLREDLERQLADQPLKFAADRSARERFRKWRRRHPRLAAFSLAAAITTALLILPTTVVAIRQSQITERAMQVATAEAKQLHGEMSEEAHVVQVLLATQTGDRAMFDQGIDRGKAVLENYGIGRDPEWMNNPRFARLSSEQQRQMRLDLGEMLVFMTRGEQMRSADSANDVDRAEFLRAAIGWHHLAEECYPNGQLPREFFRQRGQLARALPDEMRQFNSAVESSEPAEFDPYHDGVADAMAGRYREGIGKLQPFAQRHPQHFQSWYVLGLCHDRLAEFKEAAACWTGCIAINPEMALAHFNRGTSRLLLSQHLRAESDFTRALELQPEWLEARLNRAIARKNLRNYGGAIADLDTIIDKKPTYLQAWFLRAEAKESAGKPDAAKIDREEGIKLQPMDELGWSIRGYQRMAKEPAEALKDFNEAIALNKRSREALLNKSLVLADSLNRPREAVAVLDRLIECYPDHNGARAGRGVVLARIGECARARHDAVECLKHDCSSFLIYQIAGIYAQISRHETTPDAKQRALQLLGTAIRSGFSDLQTMKSDTDLDPIRSDAEFKRLFELLAGLQKSPAK